MLNHFCRHLFHGSLVTGILRGIGAAMLAGIGWKLGSDAYDSIKKGSKAARTEESMETES